MRQVIAALWMAGFFLACNGTQPTTTSDYAQPVTESAKNMTMSKKETAKAFVQAAVSQDSVKVRELVNEDYIQHNPYLPTGREPFIGLFPILQQNGTAAKPVRALEDGNYVVFHHLWTGAKPFGADEMVSFDVLRFDEKGKIAEHWDAMMPVTPPNPSGRTLLDGETDIKDLDKTAENKVEVSKLFDVIINGNQEQVGAKIMELFLPDYHQHSPTTGDGVPAVFEAFAREEWVYRKNHKVLGEGNFVLSISEGTAKGTPVVFYDLLRFENGKVAEHWDVIQAIPSENLANENTMFGFE